MGQLVYGNASSTVDIEDRTLAHLQVVILTKLRRGESFGFCVDLGVSAGGGRTTLWLSPSIPLQFVFVGGREPSLNRGWLDVLAAASNSAGGLRMVDEPPRLDNQSKLVLVPKVPTSVPVTSEPSFGTTSDGTSGVGTVRSG